MTPLGETESKVKMKTPTQGARDNSIPMDYNHTTIPTKNTYKIEKRVNEW